MTTFTNVTSGASATVPPLSGAVQEMETAIIDFENAVEEIPEGEYKDASSDLLDIVKSMSTDVYTYISDLENI